MSADGSVVIDVDMNVSDAQKRLSKINKDIATLEQKLQGKQAERSELEVQAEKIREEIKMASAEAEKFRQEWIGGRPGADRDEMDAVDKVKELQAQYNQVAANIDKIQANLDPQQTKLEALKAQFGEYEKALAGAADEAEEIGKKMEDAGKSSSYFGSRLRGVVSSALIFNAISAGLRGMTEWLGKAVQSNDAASAAIARLKGALLTMVQPILNLVVPAFMTLINVITRIVTVFAQLISLFNGGISNSKQQAQSLAQQTAGFGAAGGAANDAKEAVEEYKDATGGIDELNIISPPKEASDTTSGGGGGGGGGIAPDFSFDTESGMGFLDLLKLMLPVVGLLALAFGQLGAGIGFVVAGIVFLVEGFRSVMSDGWSLENLLTIITGLLTLGLGISLLTGSWIPLLIAALASVLLALTVTTGNGEQLIEGLKTAFSGFLEFFEGIFTGDFRLAAQGIAKIFQGLGVALDAVLLGIRDAFNNALDYINELTGGKLTLIINLIKSLWNGLVESLRTILRGLTMFLEGVFTGDWEKIWKGLVNILIGVANAMIATIEAGINFIIGLVNVFVKGTEKIVNGLRSIIGLSSVSWEIPSVSIGRIPALAQGAVIPPNRQFLAVLGDQKSGTNIEAPLDTIKQAVAEVLAQMGASQEVIADITLDLDGEVLYRGIQRASRSRGYPVGLNAKFGY